MEITNEKNKENNIERIIERILNKEVVSSEEIVSYGRRMLTTGFWAGVTVCISPALIFGLALGINHESKLQSISSERAAMAIYKPVGNGGAMYESVHGPSVERREMYENMEKISKAVMYN